MLLLQSLQD